MTIDRLSGGRLVLPVGLGTLDDEGFANVGESTGMAERAERLDESLEILTGLWSGKAFAFEGRHYRFGPMTFRPAPVQRPRIPIWVVGVWPRLKSMRRAARYDGVVAQAQDARGRGVHLSPAHVREIVEWVGRERPAEGAEQPFDVIVHGTSPADEPDEAASRVRPWAEAGATWWIEADWAAATVETLRRRIVAGPPPPTDETRPAGRRRGPPA